MDRDEFYEHHGEFPRWVLGYRDDRGSFHCLDHPSSKRSKEPALAGDREAEGAKCVTCSRHLRAASACFTLTEADLLAQT